MKRKQPQSVEIAFASLGEYRMHSHSWSEESGLGNEKPFNCTIRDQAELYTEKIELFLNEELHFGASPAEEYPLLRYTEYGLWVFILAQEKWWPLRIEEVKLDLDKMKRVRLRFIEK